ncbi:hypothetical protein ATCC90586_011274 [Pythium insidiosum]|nr:hypothetical protein ATCC90586_011274 [Pythium insidiosum]
MSESQPDGAPTSKAPTTRQRIQPRQVIERLADESALEEINLNESQQLYAAYVEEEVHDDDAPVLRDFVGDLGDTVYIQMTNLTKDEFDILWDTLRHDVLFAWERGVV